MKKLRWFSGITIVFIMMLSFVVPVFAQEDTWTQKSPLPTQLMRHSTAVVNGEIFVFGGFEGDTTNKNTKIYNYDPVNNRWSVYGNNPSLTMIDAIAAVVNNKIYLIQTTGVLDIYDPATNSWSAGAKLSPGRSVVLVSRF